MAESQRSKGSEAQVSEAQIAVHWREEELYPPPPKFVEQANAKDPAIFDRFSEEHFPDCFKEYADLLTWDEPWHTTLDTSNPPFWKWFVGGKLNASYNCVDRHAQASPDKAAIIFVPELESDDHVQISYSELHRQVNEFAAVLRDSAGPEDRRPGNAAHADGPGTAGHHAGLRPAGDHPLAGLRRVQRHRLRAPDRRLRQPGPDHDGRLLSRRPAGGPQGQGRRGARRSAPGGPGGRQGARLAPSPWAVRLNDPDDRGPGRVRRRPARRALAGRRSSRYPCRPRRRCS